MAKDINNKRITDNMALITIALIIIAVIAGIMALNFLLGLAKTVISLGCFIIAAGLLLSLLTGYDLFGVGPTVGAAVNNVTSLLP